MKPMKQVIENVLVLHSAEGPEAPAVFDSPHSGLYCPDDWNCLPDAETLRGSGVDNFIDRVFKDAPRAGAVLLEALFHRAYVDPNRSEGDLDVSMLDGPWPGPLQVGERGSRGNGLIWRAGPPDIRTGPSDLALYDRALSVAEVRHRIEAYWRPYQDALVETLNRLHDAYGVVYHFNCHANRSLSTPNAPEGPGVRRPEMEIGTLDGTTCAADYTALVRDALESYGYEVEVDGFNKGEHLIRAYADPPRGRHSMMLEIRKDMYMDEETLEPNDRFAETQANMGALARVIAEFARDRARP